MITVKNTVRIYEIDGKENDYIKGPRLEVISGSNPKRVCLYSEKGNPIIEVMGEDLIQAIRNSMNVNS